MALLHRLHHRPELDDIRSFYSDRSSNSDVESERCSYRTHSTTYSASLAKRPARMRYSTYDNSYKDEQNVPLFTDQQPQENPRASQQPQESPRASVETYASTIPDLEEDEQDELPEYLVPDYAGRPDLLDPSAVAATPSDFSELFPSRRSLQIQHDDSTLDGNMNLRVDTEVTMHGGRTCNMTLFHLRMHDLRDREFSLRRYCRDSGREVCHSSRKERKPAHQRPAFRRSLSNALSSMRSKSEQKTATMESLKRNDSGYGSVHSSVDVDRDILSGSAKTTAKPPQQTDNTTIKLEFSNYAQVDVKRAGVKGSKRYEFEYWGTQYAWRQTRKGHQSKDVSYHLTKVGSEQALAYITPTLLTPAELGEEQNMGGWIQPCSLTIVDESLVRGQKDVADAVVACALIALVDDSIRTRFHSKDAKQLLIPKLQMGVEYVGPKRLINEMFKRDINGNHSREHSRQSSSSRPTSRPSSSGGATQKTTGAIRQPSSEH